MAKRKTSKKRARNKGPIRKLWGLAKLVLLLCVLATAAGSIWYSQQGAGTQRMAQEQVLESLDWLVEQDATNRETDEFLGWLIEQIPASRGVVVSVGNIEGSDRFYFRRGASVQSSFERS